MAPVEAHFERGDRLANWKKDQIKRGDSKRIVFPSEDRKKGQAFVRCDCSDQYGEVSIVTVDPMVKGYFYNDILDDEPKEISLPTREPIRFSGDQKVEIVHQSVGPAQPETKITLKHHVAQHHDVPHIRVEQIMEIVQRVVPPDPRLVPAGGPRRA